MKETPYLCYVTASSGGRQGWPLTRHAWKAARTRRIDA